MRVFKSKIIRDQLNDNELTDLIEDFRDYKLTGVAPDTFGRDELYDHPHTMPLIKAEKVKHVHLLNAEKKWPIYRPQFYKTSDIHLVYCQGESDIGCYLLITILSPDAHEQAKNNNVMYQIGKIAEKFRLIY